jgi:hypothetical protein
MHNQAPLPSLPYKPSGDLSEVHAFVPIPMVYRIVHSPFGKAIQHWAMRESS